METIPGSFVDESVKRLRWIWVGSIPLSAGQGQVYDAQVADGRLRAILSRDSTAGGEPIWHLSVSHTGPDGQLFRLPSWDEIKHAKYQLVSEDVPMVLVFPRRAARYLDLHKTALHLYQAPKGAEL